MLASPVSAAAWVTELASRGRYHFVTDDAVKALGVSKVAARAALRRLARKGAIAAPYRGFHVIVPPEYRALGCLPADQFVPQLMARLGEAYYVALLSAAERHGAAHHRPQVFQVMVAKNRPGIACGKVRVEFIARRNAADMPTVEVNTPRGPLRVASPEATALDLVGYPRHAGGLDNVATILAELAPALDRTRLVTAAKLSPVPWAQRLGHLLDVLGASRLAEPLARYVKTHARYTTPLAPESSATGSPRDRRWRVAVNTDVEAEA